MAPYFALLLLLLAGCTTKQRQMDVMRTIDIKKTLTPETGTVLLLNGTSSSGKSAILNSFQKKHPEFKVFKIDDWFPDELKNKALELGWKKSSGVDPWKYLVNYVEQKKGKPLFDTELRAYLFSEVHLMYSEAKKALQGGRHIVIDTVFEYDPEYEVFSHFFNEFNSIKVLVYCPLDVLFERVQARNRSGIQAEMRTAFQSFEQFPAIYKLQENADEPLVDTVSSISVKSSLKAAIQELINNNIPEKYLPRLQSFEHDFIKRFKLDEQTHVKLVARHKYDLIINSAHHKPVELAAKIEPYL